MKTAIRKACVESLEQRKLLSGSQPWTTADDLPYAEANGAAQDAAGNIFIAGEGADAALTRGYAVVRRHVPGSDGSAAWEQVVNACPNPTGATGGVRFLGVSADARGNVYAVGVFISVGSINHPHWLVSR